MKRLAQIVLTNAAILALVLFVRSDSRVEFSQPAMAQATGIGGGLVRCTTSGGILGGSCTSGSPLTATVTTDSTITGTGSAGSPFAVSSTVLSGFDFGLFGDGHDGACAFNTVTPMCGATLSGSTYTLQRDIYSSGGSINSAKTVKTNGWRIFDNGTFQLDGIIAYNGNAASGATRGAALTSNLLPVGEQGGAGGASNGAAAGNGNGANPAPRECAVAVVAASGNNGGACQGGSGGSGAGGAGGTSALGTKAPANQGDIRTPWQMLNGREAGTTQYDICAGGGGGRGDAANVKTGGGGGGCSAYVFTAFHKVQGSGSIQAKGGDGAAGQAGGNTGGGGGGGGGYIMTVIGTGTCPTQTVTGGTGGAGQGTGTAGGNGGNGIAHCFKVGY